MAAAPDNPSGLASPASDRGWHAHLALQARRDGARTVVHARHSGPLRVLKALYPEDPSVCHHVMVHPPAGIVGGDRLAVDMEVHDAAHLLLTTPGATRFYRSDGAPAVQTVAARVSAGARLEWLPLETLAYSGTHAQNQQRFELAPGAEMIGWDLLSLGLPAAGLPFHAGSFHQRIELPGIWLEEGRLRATDRLLLKSALGLGGHSAMATLWWAAGHELAGSAVDSALQAARTCLDAFDGPAGATSLQSRVVVVRLLAHRVEPAMRVLRAVRLAWREQLWRLPRVEPRVWAT